MGLYDRVHNSDAVRRAARTFAQAFLGVLVVQLPADGTLWDLPALTDAGAAAAAAGVVATVTWAHNALEDSGRVKPRK